MKKLTRSIKSQYYYLEFLLKSDSEIRYRINNLKTFIKKIDEKSVKLYFGNTIRSHNSILKYKNLGLKNGFDLFCQRKKSDTIFIFGSGPSINLISTELWNSIKKHDSIGFNYWFLHEFVPTTYLLQAPSDSLYDDISSKAFLCQSNSYKLNNTLLIARGDMVNRFRFHKTQTYKTIKETGLSISTVGEYYIHGQSSVPPNELINKMISIGCFDKNNILIPKFRSTVGMLISMSLMAGYKKIVLCGIDMNDNSHFYDNYDSDKNDDIANLLKWNNKTGKAHPHQSIGVHSVKEYIYGLQKAAQNHFSAQVFVNHESSSLYPVISKFNL